MNYFFEEKKTNVNYLIKKVPIKNQTMNLIHVACPSVAIMYTFKKTLNKGM